jgi:hypothetical protein
MDGSVGEFAGKLTMMGFVITDSTKKDEVLVNGEFMGKNCSMVILGTKGQGLTYKVTIQRPREIPDSLQADFHRIQKTFNAQYGPGTSNLQQYKKRERLVYKLSPRKVMNGDVTKYSTPSGDVILKVQDGYISITYLDSQNLEVYKKEK